MKHLLQKKNEHLEPKTKDVVVGIPKKDIDEVIRYILPNEVPEKLRESLFKKMSIMKYAKKIFKELYCLESKNNESNMYGIRYYLVFLSEKKTMILLILRIIFYMKRMLLTKNMFLKKKVIKF